MKISTFVCALAGFMTVLTSAYGQFANGGFEQYTGLPNDLGLWHFCHGWGNAGSLTAHPDYYHLDGSLGGDLPQTPAAYLLPHEGRAIMGFIATGLPGTNYRTYLTTELTEELEPGASYVVSFVMTNGVVTQGSFAGLGTSHLGMCFTHGEPTQNGNTALGLTPQFVLETVEYHREWKRITFSFTADDDFTHMTFGVFGSDAGKTIEAFETNSPTLAYYFVDDFSIEFRPPGIQEAIVPSRTDSATTDNRPKPIEGSIDPPPFFVPNAFTPNGDGDNDIFKPVINDLQGYTFCVFSRWGELIYKSQSPGEGWDGLTAGGYEAGVGLYVWELRYTALAEDGVSQEIRHTGTVNLIR